jgi:hypothetical protein
MRDTKTFTTPSGKPFVLKTYLTAREVREVQASTLRHVHFSQEMEPKRGGGMEVKPVQTFDSAAALQAKDDAVIRLAVVSYDGSEETILDRILDGTNADYQSVLAEANKLMEDPTMPK